MKMDFEVATFIRIKNLLDILWKLFEGYFLQESALYFNNNKNSGSLTE